MGYFNVSLAELKKRSSEKWTQYPPDVLPLWVAEMDVKQPEELSDYIINLFRSGDLGYLSFEGFRKYCEAFADYARDVWDVNLNTQNFADTTDVVTGVKKVIDAFLNYEPRNTVIISSPIYPPFLNVFPKGYNFVDVPLLKDSDYDLDFEELEVQFKNATSNGKQAVYILCSPHNPTGKVFSEDELKKLGEIAEKTGVLVIADEIHAMLVSPSVKFVPFIKANPNAFAVTVTSASKTFSIAGTKAALIIPSSSEKSVDFVRNSGCFRKASSEQIGALAQTFALNNCRSWVTDLNKEIDTNKEVFKSLAQTSFPNAKLTVGKGTYFAWCDFTNYAGKMGGVNPSKFFIENAKVAFNNGANFAKQIEFDFEGCAKKDAIQTPYDNFVRVNLATSSEILNLATSEIKGV